MMILTATRTRMAATIRATCTLMKDRPPEKPGTRAPETWPT